MPVRGGSKGRKKSSLQDLIRERPQDLDEIINELTGANDRACALIGCTIVDNSLRDLITAHARENWETTQKTLFEGPTAPLSSFSSRIIVAYSLKIIDTKLRDQADIIRKIRNVFAHSEKLHSFEHEVIAKECGKLDSEAFTPPEIYLNARSTFIGASMNLTIKMWRATATLRKNFALAEALLNYKPDTSGGK